MINGRRWNLPVLLVGWLAAFAAGGSLGLRAASFNVANHGAVGDARTLNTIAIQATIDAASAAGGGTVTFPKGIFVSGALFLKSNVELHLDEGVELRAIQDDGAYPLIPSRVAGIEMIWPAALVNVCGQTNVSITGQGSIDGNGEFWWRKFWGADGKGGMLKDYQRRGLRWAVDYDCQRVRALLVYDSKDVKVSGITIKRSGFWSLTLTYSERITIVGVIIRANIGGHGPSSDGIDIDSSREVLVENCDIDANDDNICLKAGRDADGLRVNRPTENIIIRHCITRAGGGMFTIGSETSGGVRNVQVSDMHALGTKMGIHFKSAKIRGGVVENISILDVIMEDVERPLTFEMNWYPAYSLPTLPPELDHASNPPHWTALLQPVLPTSRGIPEVRNISISNVKAMGAKLAIAANGYQEKPVHDIRFSNITIEATTVGKISNAADWKMENVVIQTADGKPLSQMNCSAVDFPVIKSPAKLQAAVLGARN